MARFTASLPDACVSEPSTLDPFLKSGVIGTITAMIGSNIHISIFMVHQDLFPARLERHEWRMYIHTLFR